MTRNCNCQDWELRKSISTHQWGARPWNGKALARSACAKTTWLHLEGGWGQILEYFALDCGIGTLEFGLLESDFLGPQEGKIISQFYLLQAKVLKRILANLVIEITKKAVTQKWYFLNENKFQALSITMYKIPFWLPCRGVPNTALVLFLMRRWGEGR